MISKQEVEHIGQLARLELNEEEIGRLQKELSSILDYFNFLQKIDTSEVKPTFHPTEQFLREKQNKTRRDEPAIQSRETVEQLKKAFPEREKDYLKVRSIFEI